MCGHRDWFYNLDENYRTTVKLGNNSRMKVIGKGSVKIKIEGRIQIVSDVYFVPELKNHLLSIGHLQEKGLNSIQ